MPEACRNRVLRCLTRLVEARAFHESGSGLQLDDADIAVTHLVQLEGAGFVSRESSGSGSVWRLTSFGAGRLRHSRGVDAPSRVLDVRANLALEDASNFEYLSLLEESGWVMQPIPSAKAARASLPPYIAGGDRPMNISLSRSFSGFLTPHW